MNEELKNKLTERFDDISHKDVYNADLREAFLKAYIAGGIYGYQYAVDKACEWLKAHLVAPAGIPQAKSYNDAMNELTTEFRKGMED